MASGSSTSQQIRTFLIFLSGLVVGLIVLVIVLWQTGVIKIDLNRTTKNAGRVTYASVGQYIDQRVTVSGNLILLKMNDVCGGGNWSKCKLFFDDDPQKPGFGLHEVYLDIGTQGNSVTRDGKLYNTNGALISLQVSDTFNWAPVSVTGIVTGCKEGHCIITAESIVSGP